MQDGLKFSESAIVRVMVRGCEHIFGKRFKTFVRQSGLIEVLRDALQDHSLRLRGHFLIECWNNVEDTIASSVLRERPHYYGRPSIHDIGYNGVVDVGETIALKLLVGASATAFNNANAYIGTGDSSTAFAETQDDLQAVTNVLFKGMNAGYPTTPASGSVQFQSDFTNAEGNYAWAEFGTANGSNPPGTGTLLNRKVQNFGTKSSGTWTITETFTAD